MYNKTNFMGIGGGGGGEEGGGRRGWEKEKGKEKGKGKVVGEGVLWEGNWKNGRKELFIIHFGQLFLM